MESANVPQDVNVYSHSSGFELFGVRSLMSERILPVRQKRSSRTVDRLLRAAVQALNEHRIEKTTIPRIARRAGLSPGTVYRRFRDKDALLREVCLRMQCNARIPRRLLP
jgi:AcrR family transcriptional regulator